VAGGFVGERVEEELRRTLHGRINFFQKLFVAGELIMFPKVLQEPCAAHRPQAPLRAVNRRGGAPQIRVVMGHPAARTVHHLRGVRAGLREVQHHGRERFNTFPQVARLGGPVIHLGVDVDGVFAVPRRAHRTVPEALQVRGLAAGARTANQQITGELKIQRSQLRIVAAGKMPDALVRRQLHRVRFAEVQFHAPEQSLVFGDVRGEQLVESFFARSGNLFLGDDFGIAADIMIIFVTRRGGDEQCDRIGIGDGYFIRVHQHFPVNMFMESRQHTHARLKFQRTIDST